MRYLSANEFEDVKKLRADGWQIKDIARRFAVCEGTVSKVVNGRSGPREPKKSRRYLRKPIDPIFQNEDFTKYPDTVLFQHVRIWDYIG